MSKIVLFIFVCLGILNAQRIREDIQELKKINVIERPGSYIPLSVSLFNEQGDTVKLAEFFNKGIPVVFNFAYYECPMLCSQVLSALAASVNKLDWESENRYQLITVSIDSAENSEIAARKKKFYLAEQNDADIKYNWNFLTASQKTIDTLTSALGFEYYYVQETDEFAHPAVVYVLSPQGKISRYLYGLNYEPKDLKLALLEASEGKIGNTFEKLILYCYHYDATSNTYVLFAQNLMRLGGILTLIILGLFLGFYWIKENRKQKLAH